MPPEPGHRASDADREVVSAVIRDAAGEGRIGLDELDERLAAVWAAKTYGELAVVTADLPAALPVAFGGGLAGAAVPTAAAGQDRTPVVPGVAPETGHAIAIFSGHERRGTWRVPAQLNAVAIFGGIDMDLRQATLTAAETVITVFAMFGGVEITVPDDVDLRVSGVGIFGGFQGSTSGDVPPGAPVIHVRGAAVFGGVEVKRRPRTKKLATGPTDRTSGRPRLDKG